MTALIECVPNVSEGRDRGLIAAMAEAITAAGAGLLDVHSDADHHRSVFTFAGERAVVEAAMTALAAVAFDAIDLEQHTGVHPRIGAVDVIPFVPLHGVTLRTVAEWAREYGRRFAQHFAVPVYAYEASALRPERVSLPDIRRGGYAGLKHALAADPARTPDFGPTRIDGRGASVIGARRPLVAYNVNLDSADVAIAQVIARGIRESGGGLARVRAIGVLVGGKAQVSMNVLDFRVTDLYTVISAVERAAAEHGVAIAHGELIGLVPQAAVRGGFAALYLPESTAERILENRLSQIFGEYGEVEIA